MVTAPPSWHRGRRDDPRRQAGAAVQRDAAAPATGPDTRPAKPVEPLRDVAVDGLVRIAVLIAVDDRQIYLAVTVVVELEQVRLTVTVGVDHPDVGLSVVVGVERQHLDALVAAGLWGLVLAHGALPDAWLAGRRGCHTA